MMLAEKFPQKPANDHIIVLGLHISPIDQMPTSQRRTGGNDRRERALSALSAYGDIKKIKSHQSSAERLPLSSILPRFVSASSAFSLPERYAIQEGQCGRLQVFAGIFLPTSFWCSIGHLKKKYFFWGELKCIRMMLPKSSRKNLQTTTLSFLDCISLQ